jgi:S-DNA-T family DNA segregation ATPase FtsK/SpoIIIE
MARDPYRRNARRLRRQMRKNGDPYAVLLAGPDDSFSAAALAAAARWAYRHRSAFYPVALALAVVVAAGACHGHRVPWWPAATATALAAFLLAAPRAVLRRHRAGRAAARVLAWTWERCGIARGLERAYAAAVLTAAGGWLAAATAAGPGTQPLPKIAAAATLLLSVPWWFHRRRRAKVRVETIVEGWPALAESIGLAGARITSVVVDAWGWTARVALRKGTTVMQAVARIPEIESGLGVPPGSVRIFPDTAHAGKLTMRVAESEPLAAVTPWPGTAITTVRQPAEIGISETGQPVRAALLRRNVLIGGIMGAGKSGILNLIIANLAACRDVELWGSDLKGGMELRPWASCFARLAFTPEEAARLYRDAVGEVNKRAARMAAEGKRLWEPSPDAPALVIISDEHAELPDEAHDCADSIARRGRAVAVTLVAATQRPTQASMGGTSVRSQMDTRICLRVREPRDADLILGQHAVTSGWHPHKLTRAGEFMISGPEHTEPDRNRAYLLADEQRDRHAARCGAGRNAPPVPPETAADAPAGGEIVLAADDSGTAPETLLWAALSAAGPDGAPAAVLVKVTGMGRTWVYDRLRQWARNGRVIQTVRGRWRAAGDSGGTARP